METATIPTPIGPVGADSFEHLPDVAGTCVVDAYATRVLRVKSPSEACIDESLGPYVTSLLRSALENSPGSDVAAIPEYESLMELLEEHCSLNPESAQSALQSIARAVKTGVIESLDDFPMQNKIRTSHLGPIGKESPWSVSMGEGNAVEPLNSMGEAWSETSAASSELALRDSASMSSQRASYEITPQTAGSRATIRCSDNITPSTDDRSSSSATEGGTPLKPDRLIPVDLMGVLDDPSTPTSMKDRNRINAFDFDPPPAVPAASTKKTPASKSKKMSKEEAKELTASLFRPSRVRQNSIDGEAKSPKLMPKSGNYAALQSTTLEPTAAPFYASSGENHMLFQHQLDSVVEILLSMNSDLGQEPASEAAMVADMDVNVAQYVVDGALSAPPVCRHLLKDGCYRSDCQFSHDVEGHTCLFWLRGRCGKGESCRFLHGYGEKLLDGIKSELLPGSQASSSEGSSLNGAMLSAQSDPLPVQTTNLVKHNVNMSFSAPQHSGSPFTFMSSSTGFETSAFTFPPPSNHQLQTSWESSLLDAGMNSMSVTEKDGAGSAVSFASIASKGYNKTSFPLQPGGIGNALAASSNKEAPKSDLVKIPQDLWNPHENRSSEVFHIADPLERYRQVSASVAREDVIDLHFQSTNTFQYVLSSVLPDKLHEHGKVWVVTGTGHHVGTKTHQKGGGALENAVASWLETQGYNFCRGRDRNGYGGALLVKI